MKLGVYSNAKKMNAKERQHILDVKQLGCYVCNLHGRYIPAEAHHITLSGRRLGHFYTIPLCFNHHNQQTPLGYGESVHNGTKRFEQKYGTQKHILSITNQKIYGNPLGMCDKKIIDLL